MLYMCKTQGLLSSIEGKKSKCDSSTSCSGTFQTDISISSLGEK